MTLDPTGAWGLRHRLQVALSLGYSYDGLAILLNVPAEVLRAYMADLAYVLEPGYVASIVEHLFDIETPDLFYDKTTTAYGVTITYVESPWWTEEQLDGLMVPDLATAFKVHYQSESEQHRPMSTPLYYLASADPATVAQAAVGGDLSRLICIVFYEYKDIDA